MLLDNEIVVKKYPDWVTGREPLDSELEDRRKDWGLWIGRFLVSAEGSVQIELFRRQSNRKKGKWDSVLRRIDGWMPLPKPIGK